MRIVNLSYRNEAKPLHSYLLWNRNNIFKRRLQRRCNYWDQMTERKKCKNFCTHYFTLLKFHTLFIMNLVMFAFPIPLSHLLPSPTESLTSQVPPRTFVSSFWYDPLSLIRFECPNAMFQDWLFLSHRLKEYSPFGPENQDCELPLLVPGYINMHRTIRWKLVPSYKPKVFPCLRPTFSS